jgi:N-methylhydantoinase A
VSDADVVLGYLDRKALLGGALPIDADAAAEAIAEKIGKPLGLNGTAAAAGIIDVVSHQMAEALRIVSVERGFDPREFALVAFGGAGPVHAVRLAAELDIPEVIVPPIPGAFSALGLVATDLRRDYVKTLYAELGKVDLAALACIYSEMEASARAMLREARIPEDRWELARSADLRYRRQAYELTVPMRSGAITREMLDILTDGFHEKHRQTYGHANPGEAVQLVNVRLTALGRLKGLEIAQKPVRGTARVKGERQTWFRETGFIATPVLAREALEPGATVAGPAIVEAVDTTVVVPPGWAGSVDVNGFLVIKRT